MKVFRTLVYCLAVILSVSAVDATDLKIKAVSQPKIPVTFKALHATDDPVSEKSELSFMVENKSGADIRMLDLAIFYVGADGKIHGGEGMRYPDLHANDDGTLTGSFPLFPRSQVLAAKQIVIGFVRVEGVQQSWEESTDEVLQHIKELQPNVALNGEVKTELVRVHLGVPRTSCPLSASATPSCPPLPCD